jgi:ACR3 family arsenite transporter
VTIQSGASSRSAAAARADASSKRGGARLGVVERYLSLWGALCIVAGVALGRFGPAPFHLLGATTVAQVNPPVAGLVWLMIVPMLLKIDFGALHQVREHWRGIGVTLFIN